MLEVLFSHARKRIWIASGYFLVDKRSQELLADAARRGVDVRVMFPGRYNDKRVAEWAGESTLEPMIDAGVAAFLYQKTMLHAKIILVDHSIAAVGSTNLNQRSLRKDEEVSMVIEHPPTVQLLSSHYQQDLQDCRSLKRRRWHHRGILQRMREAVTVPLHHNV
jgi:cardiolipin synthase